MRRSGLMMMLVFLPLLGTLLLFSFLLKTSSIPQEVQAASVKTWDGGGADNNWNTPANWVGDLAPVAGDSLIFDVTGVATRPAPVNNFANLTSFDSITISDSGYTLSGNSVSLTTGLTADTYASGTSTVSLIIAGAGSVTMSATATAILTVSGVNTFTGGLTINSGTVKATTSNKTLGGATGTGTVTLGNTTGTAAANLLVGTAGLTYANPIVLATNPTVGTLSMGNTGTAISTTFSGGVTGSNNFTINSNATTGAVVFSTVSINNAGTVTNIGAGTGTTVINGGIGANVTEVILNSTTSGLTVSINALTVNASGTTVTNIAGTKGLSINGGVTGTGNLIINNNSATASGIGFSTNPVNNTGTITNSGTNAGTGTVGITGGVGANVTGIIQNSTTSALTIGGVGLIVNVAGTTLTNTVGVKALSVTGGVTGTGNLILHNDSATAVGISISSAAVNNTGTVTNSGSGSGTSTISSVISTNVTGVVENSATSGLNLSGVNTFASGLTIKSGTVTATTSNQALGGAGIGTVTLGDTTGTAAANLLVGTTGLTYANPIVLATNPTVGTLSMGNTGTAISTTFSGGVTGSNNFTINSNATTGTVTYSTVSLNNAGTITHVGAGTGTASVTGGVSSNVTAITQNSTTSALTVSTTALTVNSGGTTLTNTAGTKALTITGGITGTGNLIFNNDSSLDAGITLTTTPVSITGIMTNSGTGTGSVTISGGVDSSITAITQNSTTSSLVIHTTALTVNSGGTTLTNAAGGAALAVGSVIGTGDLITNNNSSLAQGIMFSPGSVNNTGELINSGTGTGSVLIGGGLGTNVTSFTKDSGTSVLVMGQTEQTLTFGGTGGDVAQGVAVDSSGNVYISGYFAGTADFDPSAGTDNKTSLGGADIYLTKINADGSYGYTYTFGGTGDDQSLNINIGTGDNVYVTGYFNDVVDFDPSAGTDNKTSLGGADIYLTKINADGSYGYTYTFGGTGTDKGNRVVVDSNSIVYLTGYFNDVVDFDPSAGTDNKTSAGVHDAFLIKINADGSYGYTYAFGGTGTDTIRGVAVDSSDNVYLSGGFNDVVDFDPSAGTDNQTSVGASDIFIAKINSDGSYGYAYTFGGTLDDSALDVDIDNSDNFYLFGIFRDITDFDPSAGVDNKTSAGAADIFLTKINADGSYGYTYTFGGTLDDVSQSAFIDTNETIYLTGYFIGTADFDPSASTDNKTSAGGTEIYLTKINADDSYGGTDTFGGTINDVGYGVSVGTDDSLYLTGYFTTAGDFDPSIGVDNKTSAGGIDAFLTIFTSVPADAAQSTLTPASSSVAANGINAAVLTVTGKDILGDSVGHGGATVVISKISGTGTVGSVTDNGDGTYTANVTSAFVPGTGTFVATLDGDAVKGGLPGQTEVTVDYIASSGGSSLNPIGSGGIAFTSSVPSVLQAGALQTVAWTTSGEKIQRVQLDVSYDGGVLWTPIASSLLYFDTYIWTVPNRPADQVMLRITGYDTDNVVIDQESSNLFAILGQGVVPPPSEVSNYAHLPVLAVTTPEGDALAGITLDVSGQRVAPRTQITGLSPLDGSLEAISRIQTGWLIRSESYNTVYYVGNDGMRHAFWDTQAYFTWSDTWNDVIWVTDATLPTLPLGTPVLAKPRVVLVKVNSDPSVYQVDADGVNYAFVLREIDSEEIAINTYGANWADYVIDVDPTLMGYYLRGASVAAPESVDLTIMKTRVQLARLASEFAVAELSPTKTWINTIKDAVNSLIISIYQ